MERAEKRSEREKRNKERDPKSILKFRLRYHWYHKKISTK